MPGINAQGADVGGVSGNVRLVFRSKTNRGFADSDSRNSGYNSAGRGAVILDDVVITKGGGGPITLGNFEVAENGGANAIDNRPCSPPLLTRPLMSRNGRRGPTRRRRGRPWAASLYRRTTLPGLAARASAS